MTRQDNRYHELMQSRRLESHTFHDCCAQTLLRSILRIGQEIGANQTARENTTWTFTDKNQRTELITMHEGGNWKIAFFCPEHGARMMIHLGCHNFKTFSLICAASALQRLQSLEDNMPMIKAASIDDRIELEQKCLERINEPWNILYLKMLKKEIKIKIVGQTKYFIRSRKSVLIMDYTSGFLEASYIDEETCRNVFLPIDRLYEEADALIDEARANLERAREQARRQVRDGHQRLQQAAQERHLTMRRNAELKERFPEEEVEDD